MSILTLLERFGRALLTALMQSRARDREFDELRLSLEQQISERTATAQATFEQLTASQTTMTLLGPCYRCCRRCWLRR